MSGSSGDRTQHGLVRRACGTFSASSNHRAWYEAVSSQLAERGITDVDYRLCPCEPERAETPESIAAMFFASDYARDVDAFGPKSLDFALVDGKYRSACAFAMLPSSARVRFSPSTT